MHSLYKRRKNPSTSLKSLYSNPIPPSPDRSKYIEELQRASPVNTSYQPPYSAIIPNDLGKSEKFLEKPKILKILSQLNFVKSPKPEPQCRTKESTSIKDPNSFKPTTSHILFKRTLTPFSPGVVRIRSQTKLRSFTRSPSSSSIKIRVLVVDRPVYLDPIPAPKPQPPETGYFEKEYENKDSYKGSLLRSKRHGMGVYYYSSFHLTYTGMFKKNKPHGEGILSFAGGHKIEGTFNEGFLEDLSASITYSNLYRYEGEVLNAQRHGQGTLDYFNKGIYRGPWKTDQRSGKGIILSSGFFLFEGQFKSDFTEGPGVLVFYNVFKESSTSEHFPSLLKHEHFFEYKNFHYFESVPISNLDLVFMTLSKSSPHLPETKKKIEDGKFLAGKLNAAGHAKYGHVGEYFGEFKDGKRHGYGVMRYTDPEHVCEWLPETEGVYLGEWKEDKRHGLGEMVWDNGTRYEGMFVNDRRNGVSGKVTFVNGDFYDGGFVNEKMMRSHSITKASYK